MLLVVLLLAGCAGPEREWLGEWDVRIDETRTPCGGGASDAADSYVLWRIENSAELGPFLAGECSFPLAVRSATFAEFRRSTCESSLPDGRPVTLVVTGGSLTMDADRASFTGSLSSTVEIDGACLDVRDEVSATRRF